MSTKKIVGLAIGIALFVVLSAVKIPLVPNTSIPLQYIALVIFAVYFGPGVGFAMGFAGHALNDAIFFSSIWWSWVLVSAAIGLFVGFANKYIDIEEGKIDKKGIAFLYVFSLLGVAVGMLLAYIGDVFLYQEPSDKILIQVLVAFVINIAVIFVVANPIVIGFASRNKKARGFDE